MSSPAPTPDGEAVPRSEAQYRVEVWDKEETALVETIARSSDLQVSIAAWQAALRRRPGLLLIHKNGRHVMDKMVAPGDPSVLASTVIDNKLHEGLDAALGDLRSWHRLKAVCLSCRHRSTAFDVDALKRKFGADVFLSFIEKKAKCSKCRRGPVRMEIFSEPRN